MKNIKKIVVILTIVFAIGQAKAISQTWEIYKGDTINYTDANNKKQGYWVYWYTKGGQIKEEGNYKSSRKEGLWKKYFPTGSVWSEITYKNNKSAGPYTTYYENGKVEEQGNFYGVGKGKTTGEFVRYFENGKVAQEKKFNDNGVTDGLQKIYHENGQVAVEWTSSNGAESGLLTRYYPNGDVESKVTYGPDGTIASSETFEMKNPEVTVVSTVPIKTTVVKHDDHPNGSYTSAAIGDGQNTLYNASMQVSQSGYFEGDRLKNGKMYIYNSDGILERIEIYEDFKYKGNGVIDQ